mmetsp:Transcript_10287/g.29277  ORF Transcript_10287/g.29277 Transcript_10287/m.29277 type:complete len:296 (-) Transcript_10287:49-936(-)
MMFLRPTSSTFLFLLVIEWKFFSSDSFSVPQLSSSRSPNHAVRSNTKCQATRRDVLSTVGGLSSLVLLPNSPAFADEEKGDMTSQLFNPDGSLKEGTVEEAKERPVELKWDISENGLLFIDGVNAAGTTTGSQIRLSYELPEKWSDGKGGDEIYFDRSEGLNAKACKGITIFQAPGRADLKRLQKATTIGVAKALGVPESLKRLYQADIVSGRVSNKDGQSYYEFDMAAAPETCGDSKENLGLGFCPYDNIFLLSATIFEDRLYCIAVECDSTKIWKLASSDLKRVRSSFKIDRA